MSPQAEWSAGNIVTVGTKGAFTVFYRSLWISRYTSLSVLLFLTCTIYHFLSSLSLCLSLNLSLPVAVGGEWRPSAALLPLDIWRRAETQRQERTHTHWRTRTHARGYTLCLCCSESCAAERSRDKEWGTGWSRRKERRQANRRGLMTVSYHVIVIIQKYIIFFSPYN